MLSPPSPSNTNRTEYIVILVVTALARIIVQNLLHSKLKSLKWGSLKKLCYSLFNTLAGAFSLFPSFIGRLISDMIFPFRLRHGTATY